jgi:hypothetical protein
MRALLIGARMQSLNLRRYDKHSKEWPPELLVQRAEFALFASDQSNEGKASALLPMAALLYAPASDNARSLHELKFSEDFSRAQVFATSTLLFDDEWNDGREKMALNALAELNLKNVVVSAALPALAHGEQHSTFRYRREYAMTELGALHYSTIENNATVNFSCLIKLTNGVSDKYFIFYK